jgi:hypothetical protein
VLAANVDILPNEFVMIVAVIVEPIIVEKFISGVNIADVESSVVVRVHANMVDAANKSVCIVHPIMVE